MISQIFTQNTFKIISLFSLSPGSSFNRKAIKEKTKLNNIPLDEAIARLISSEILKKEKNYYSINFENEYSQGFIDICSKQQKQMKNLPLNIYFLITDFVLQISTHKHAEAYLFGSYSKLIFTEKSDVDIAVVSIKIDKKAIEKTARKLEKTYKKQIQLHYFEKKAFYKNKKDPIVKEIIENGIKLT